MSSVGNNESAKNMPHLDSSPMSAEQGQHCDVVTVNALKRKLSTCAEDANLLNGKDNNKRFQGSNNQEIINNQNTVQSEMNSIIFNNYNERNEQQQLNDGNLTNKDLLNNNNNNIDYNLIRLSQADDSCTTAYAITSAHNLDANTTTTTSTTSPLQGLYEVSDNLMGNMVVVTSANIPGSNEHRSSESCSQISELIITTTQPSAATTASMAGTLAAIPTTATNNDLTFNLIGNATFINDLFAYDIVPVAIAHDANIVTANSASSSSATTTTTLLQPTFTTPTNVQQSFGDDDDAISTDWQTGDLLELDHRYNSGLQTEISQLNATINFPNDQGSIALLESTSNNVLMSDDRLQPQDHPQLHHHQQLNVNVSQQQSLLKYRSVNNLANLHLSSSNATTNHNNNNSNNNNDSTTENDFEYKNLSWLLNFKFDELPHLSPDLGANNCNGNAQGATNKQQQSNLKSCNVSSPSASMSSSSGSISANGTLNSERDRSRSPKTSTKTSKKFEELVMEVTSEMDGNEMIVAENVVVEDSPIKAPKKPPFTYTELIEYALEDRGELTVSGIYQWISDRFPYYKTNDDRWKNSVRHNLSINPHFRKGVKATQGAGHLWTISSGDSAENALAWEHKKQRLELFFKMESINRERMQQHRQQQQQQQQQSLKQDSNQRSCAQCISPNDCQQHQNNEKSTNNDQCCYDETAAATATITQEMLQQQPHSCPSVSLHNNCCDSSNNHNNNNNTSSDKHDNYGATTITTTANSNQIINDLPFNDLMSDEELRKTAGQILNGIHRDVEVQSVNSIIGSYHDVLLDNDYLNPINKDVSVNEGVLRHIHSHHHHHHSHNHHLHGHSNNSQALHLGNSMQINSNHGGHHLSGHHMSNGSNNAPISSQYYITEIDPLELGVQMSHDVGHDEEEVLFSDDFNLNYFTYNPGNDIVA